MNSSHLSINDLASFYHLSLFLALFSLGTTDRFLNTYWLYDLSILKTSLFCHYYWYPFIHQIWSILFLEGLLYLPLLDPFTLLSLAVQTSSVSYLNYLRSITVFLVLIYFYLCLFKSHKFQTIFTFLTVIFLIIQIWLSDSFVKTLPSLFFF